MHLWFFSSAGCAAEAIAGAEGGGSIPIAMLIGKLLVIDLVGETVK
jgi:hypothetical protein